MTAHQSGWRLSRQRRKEGREGGRKGEREWDEGREGKEKKEAKDKYWWGYEETGTLCLAGEIVKCCNHCRNRVSPKNWKRNYHSNPTIPPLDFKRTESQVRERYSHTRVHSGTTHNSQEVEAMQDVAERCGRVSFSLKRKAILTPATTWRNLENIPGAISLSKKGEHYRAPLTWGIQNSRIYRNRK